MAREGRRNRKGTHEPTARPQAPPDARRAEALAANPDNAEDEAERDVPLAGEGPARAEALGANPDEAAEEAERQWEPAGRGARRAESLEANPDTEAEEAGRVIGRAPRPRGE